MIKGQNVLLTKVSIINSDTKYYSGYWLKGTLLSDITIGTPIVVLRYQRADPKDHKKICDIHGIFQSSEVIEIVDEFVKTKNSIWKIEKIKEEAPLAQIEEVVK